MAHGTATNFPEVPDELELPGDPKFPWEPAAPEREPWLAEVGELVLEVSPELVSELEPELSEINAKSTRPELGLMITSLIVPTAELPEEPLISAPISLLA